MRHAYLLALPALLLCQPAAAQLQLGAKAGMNFCGAGRVDFLSRENIIRFGAGAVARYSFGPRQTWRVQAELLCNGKGNESTSPGNPAVAPYYHRLSFFELPVLAQLHVFGLTLEAGPQLSYLFGSEYKTADETYLFRRGLRLGQLGYAAGIGGELPDGFHITMRFSRDLTSRLKPTYDRQYVGRYNYLMQIQLGYLLPARES
jgi:hypothetical protein